MSYEVHPYTICQGWINCWLVGDELETFETIKAAQAEIDDLISTTETECEDAHDPEDYRIFDIENKEYVG